MLRFSRADALTAQGAGGVGIVQGTAGGAPATFQNQINAASVGVGIGKGKATGAPLTLGSTLGVWLAFVALVIGFMLIGQRVGSAEEFRSVRLTFFNAVAVSMLAIVGIIFWKLVFSAVKIPYVSDLVLEA